MPEPTMRIAGIDVGKSMLDYAVDDSASAARFANNAAGWAELCRRLAADEVGRVGLEASGGYEAGVAGHLQQAGIEVVVLQPIQVRAFARARGNRAKNDRLDAKLIAAFTAVLGGRSRGGDPRLVKCRKMLVFLEQIEQDIIVLKTRLEHTDEPRIMAIIKDSIKAAEKMRADEFGLIIAMLKAFDDLKKRLELLTSIPGVGDRTGIALVIAMPELGRLSREEAAALAGLAPFDQDSGNHHGERHIAGGRARVRTALYKAAVPASTQWNPILKAFYQRLIAAGKKPKQAFVACARKLLIIANVIIQRGSPWSHERPA